MLWIDEYHVSKVIIINGRIRGDRAGGERSFELAMGTGTGRWWHRWFFGGQRNRFAGNSSGDQDQHIALRQTTYLLLYLFPNLHLTYFYFASISTYFYCENTQFYLPVLFSAKQFFWLQKSSVGGTENGEGLRRIRDDASVSLAFYEYNDEVIFLKVRRSASRKAVEL